MEGRYTPVEVWQAVLFIAGMSVFLGCFLVAMADETGWRDGERLLFFGATIFVLSAVPVAVAIGGGF